MLLAMHGDKHVDRRAPNSCRNRRDLNSPQYIYIIFLKTVEQRSKHLVSAGKGGRNTNILAQGWDGSLSFTVIIIVRLPLLLLWIVSNNIYKKRTTNKSPISVTTSSSKTRSSTEAVTHGTSACCSAAAQVARSSIRRSG